MSVSCGPRGVVASTWFCRGRRCCCCCCCWLRRSVSAYLADLLGCGLRGTNHAFEVFRGPQIYTAYTTHGVFRCSSAVGSPERTCPNHNSVRVQSGCNNQSIHAQNMIINVRVPSASDNQTIHAQTMIAFVIRVHPKTRASMPIP